MTDAQKWYIDLIAAQHLGDDNQDQINVFVLQQAQNDLSTGHIAETIDRLRRTVPETAKPTPKLLDTIVRTAKKGNFHHLHLKEEELLPILEKEHNVWWDEMTANTALRVLDSCRQKVNWAKGYKRRFVHGYKY